MLLGIEIGGTKLQLGVGTGESSKLVAIERLTVDPARGALGILEQIELAAPPLVERHGVERIGIGFGGPIHAARGVALRSHQIEGWNDFPIVEWCERALGKPAVLGNDADLAALAEARFGAGRGANPVFYVTVGTGIGGGLVVGGQVYQGRGLGAAEIGHLRPGLQADRADDTVESIASGWGIAAAAQARVTGEPVAHRMNLLGQASRPASPSEMLQRLRDEEEALEEFIADLLGRAEGQPEAITARIVAQAAAAGNELARDVLNHAWQALGWAIAQVITLIAPEVVVIGGGVALMGEELFLIPVRSVVERYVFPPFQKQYRIELAELGEEMVVYGALALARGA